MHLCDHSYGIGNHGEFGEVVLSFLTVDLAHTMHFANLDKLGQEHLWQRNESFPCLKQLGEQN